MSDGSPPMIDTRDMVAVHEALSRALDEAPTQILTVSDGDAVGASRLGDYLSEVLWLLHAHHVGEDELLYPLLSERSGEHRDLFARMDEQHRSVAAELEGAQQAARAFATTSSATDGERLSKSCSELSSTMATHLADEEERVLPLARRHISPPEWGALPAHAMSHYEGERIWLPFGLVLEAMPTDVREDLLAHVPPPIADMWFGGGSQAFNAEMSKIRAANP